MAYGFKPLRYFDGSPYTGALMSATVTAEAVDLFKGDPMEMAAAGTIERAADGSVQVIGVASYFEWTDALGNFNQDMSITTTVGLTVTCYYVPVENLIFSVQEDADGGALAVTEIGANIDFIEADGSATTKLSGYLLDSSSATTTSTLNCRIVRLGVNPGNVVGTANDTEWDVVFNAHFTRIGATGI